MIIGLTFWQSTLFVIIFFFSHWYLSLFAQSFFYHRYAAHQQFTMSKFWERFFYFIGWVFQGSSYLNVTGYAVMHRLHHAHTDTEKDPHSPKFSANLFKMMWETKKYYKALNENAKQVDEKYMKNIPQWKTMNFIADTWVSRISWGALYVICYALFAHPVYFLLLPIHFLMGPFHGVIINWFAHKIGYMNYFMKNTSKNILNIDFLMWGEGLHNNHHRKPYSPNFAQRWFEFDPMYPIIKIFHWVRIIRLQPIALKRK